MKFETLLARRYITAQKRHSVLTTCSIVIAVALMTMLFCLYSTLMTVKRNEAYDDLPGHFALYGLSDEQAEKLKTIPEIGEIRTEEEYGKTVRYIVLDQEIDSEKFFIDRIKETAGIEKDNHDFHYNINDDLLSYDRLTDDAKLEMAMTFAMFFVVVIVFMLLLRLVIDTSFEVSSKERERQFGVLQSVGATPKQIVRIMTSEGIMLSVIGVPLGGALGVLLGYVTYRAVLTTGIAKVMYGSQEKIDRLVTYSVSPWMVALGMLLGFVWVMFSAYGTGMRVIKKSPVEAISARPNAVKKIRRFSISGLLFGWTGKLASRNARRQKKRFIITVLSLTLSLLMFAVFGVIMDLAEDYYRRAWFIVDDLGIQESDFVILYSAAELPDQDDTDEEIVQSQLLMSDPLAYREGIKILSDSGYFTDIEYVDRRHGKMLKQDGTVGTRIQVYYLNRVGYDRIWKYQEAPMSYDEFVKYGKAITLNAPQSFLDQKPDAVTFQGKNMVPISAEEGEKFYDPDADQDTDEERIVRIGDGTEHDPYVYYKLEHFTATLPVGMDAQSKYANNDSSGSGEIWLLLPEERYEQDLAMYGGQQYNFGFTISCKLKNESDYQKATDFIDANRHLMIGESAYDAMRTARTVLAAVKMAALFINLMVALIAAVNMVNIISTGIINRKSELASMQCCGMTRGQMYRMSVIECLQFVLRAAVCASILAVLIIWGTDSFMNFVVGGEIFAQRGMTDGGVIVSYSVPVVRIWLSAAVAFVIAICASLLPLRRMQQEPLVEQIRAVE